MPHLLNSDALDALARALCGTYTLPLCEGGAQVVCAALPGRALVTATRRDGVLWVVLDLDKPAAPRHARAMLREWRDLYLAGFDAVDEPFADPCPDDRAPLRLVG